MVLYLDETRNLSQWVRYTAENSPDRPLFAYAHTGSQPRLVTWSEVGTAVERAASVLDSLFGLTDAGPTGSESGFPVVGILGNLETINYHVLYLGILRAGGVAFLISTRNSPAAVSHLLRKTGTRKLLVSPDDPIQTLTSAALALAAKEDHQVKVCIAPTLQALSELGEAPFPKPAGLDTPLDGPGVILHSSGSTAFPKPITLTHRAVLQWSNLTDIVGVDAAQNRLAVHALPVYHGMGFFVSFWTLRTGLTLGVFPPQNPPVVPSPATFLESAIASQSSFMMCVPLFVEIWSHDPDAVAKLRNFAGIIFGGGPFNAAVGEDLTKRGVQLIGFYGATEVGPATMLVKREPGDDGWDWLHLPPRSNPKFLPQDDPNVFELVYMECATHRPVICNAVVDGNQSFATNDIVLRHPDDPLKFKIQGRKDDQIMLSSGEKTNPGPLEVIICRDKLVAAAVMFGRGREQNGIIIQPVKEHEFDPKDTAKLSNFRNAIWPSVEKANEFAPSHSRLFKEMILVTYPSRPFELTAKLWPRRQASIEAYKDEINTAYNAIETSTELEIPLPPTWKFDAVLEYVRAVVHKVMDKEIGDDADIFDQGGNSLLATYIRNSLVYALRQVRTRAARNINQNFVYSNPTIVGLARQLLSIVNENSASEVEQHALKLKSIEGAISDLSANFPKHAPRHPQPSSEGEIVLLTGTTGGLGSQLLVTLTASPEVAHVYALNRRSANGGKSMRARQTEALVERGLDAGVIDSPKVTLVEANLDDLDIDPVLYNEIRDNITLIIHNAWRVNFNLGFGAFKSNMRSVRSLIDLALLSPRQTPPRLIYTSSVGVFRNWDSERGQPLEAPIDDPRLVLGSGYAESKFVGERVLENAANLTPLRPIIVRIAQLTSTPKGAWNAGDWLPAIVRSGQVLRVLPARGDCISWIPLEAAARALFEFRQSDSQYLNLAHPKLAHWNTVFEVFSSQLGVPLVSWTEWLAKLEKSDGGPGNPAVYLLDFFRGCTPVPSKDREAPGIPLLDLQKAVKNSATLADPELPTVCRDDAERWIKHWKAIGFLA